MKLENLFETITFIPTYIDKKTGHYMSPYEIKEGPCSLCDGEGTDYNDETQPCKQCEGKRIIKQRVYTVPELNVANHNAHAILHMLGLSTGEDDSTGTIPNKDLPAIRRKLIMLKNKDPDRQKYVIDPSDTRSGRTRHVDYSGDVPKIEPRGGMRIISGGRSDNQINRYIDKLLELISVAQTKDLDLSWS